MASSAGAQTRSTKSKTTPPNGRATAAASARAGAKATPATSSAKRRAAATEGSAHPGAEMQAGLTELFSTMLKDIYYAEKQILKTLPKMAKAAKNAELKQGFELHREETAGQIERLEKIFASMGQKPKAEQCAAIEGIIEEGKDVMEDFKGKPVLDVGLCGAGKAVEHYEIARYASMKTLAQHLGMKDAAKLIDASLAEEMKTDKLLDQTAQTLLLAKPA